MSNPENEFDPETVAWSKSYRGANNTYPVMDIEQRLRRVEKRLLIIDPPAAHLDKYPALREAYENYKIIERLTLGND